MKWLEISLTLTGEIAEAAVEVLSRISPNSIALEYPLEGDHLDPHAQVILRAYLKDGPDLDEQRKEIEVGLWHLSQIEPFDPPSFTWVEEERWEDAWKVHYHPIEIGERLLVQPAWLARQESDRLTILMDPGMAFGTGTHPTTQLCLLALEKYLRAGGRVVDLGCGSGILSIAAAQLGASQVFALDTDPDAIDYARKNVEVNSSGDKIIVEYGSLDRLRTHLHKQGAGADMLVANILTKVILELLEEGLGETVQSNGIVILSGILDHQEAEVIRAAQAHQLHHLESLASADWRALIFKRKSPPQGTKFYL